MNTKKLIEKARNKKVGLSLDIRKLESILSDFRTRKEIADELSINVKNTSINWKFWQVLKQLIKDGTIVKIKVKDGRDAYYISSNAWKNIPQKEKQQLLQYYEVVNKNDVKTNNGKKN